MRPDTRSRNTYFNPETASGYLQQYVDTLAKAAKSVDPRELDRAIEIVTRAREAGRHIYVAGNGGSASISDHLCCDWTKGVFFPGEKPIKIDPLSSHLALVTAIANDMSYEEVFSHQIEMFGEKGDVLMVISSSGNSPNVVRAAEEAKKRGMPVITLTGFTGGKLKAIGDANLYVPFDNYGVVEDGHQMLMHVIAQVLYLRAKR